MKIRIRVIHPDADEPMYKTAGSAGFDLSSIEDVTLQPGEIKKIRTGLIIEIPDHLELQVRARSSMSLKGIVPAAGVATIDSDYREELYLVMRNLNKEEYVINKGDRIAQGVFAPLVRPMYFEAIEEDDGVPQISVTYKAILDNVRSGGFGSTGI